MTRLATDQGFWATPEHWPDDAPATADDDQGGYVFLARAVHSLGKALGGWTELDPYQTPVSTPRRDDLSAIADLSRRWAVETYGARPVALAAGAAIAERLGPQPAPTAAQARAELASAVGGPSQIPDLEHLRQQSEWLSLRDRLRPNLCRYREAAGGGLEVSSCEMTRPTEDEWKRAVAYADKLNAESTPAAERMARVAGLLRDMCIRDRASAHYANGAMRECEPAWWQGPTWRNAFIRCAVDPASPFSGPGGSRGSFLYIKQSSLTRLIDNAETGLTPSAGHRPSPMIAPAADDLMRKVSEWVASGRLAELIPVKQPWLDAWTAKGAAEEALERVWTRCAKGHPELRAPGRRKATASVRSAKISD